jgi:hypothetical protein
MNDLVIPNNNLVKYSEDQISSVVSSSDYFKRLQLMGANSDAVKEGKIGMGHYALVTDKENMKDLGNQVDVLVCSMRLKAMQITDDNQVINTFDANDPEFTRIKDIANVDANAGCLCGCEFLLWLPSDECFVTLFMASKSARREAPNVRAMIDEKEGKPGPATLTVKLAKNTKYSWHVTKVQKCTTEFNLPDSESFVDAVTKFQNPPKNEVETVAPQDTQRAR